MKAVKWILPLLFLASAAAFAGDAAKARIITDVPNGARCISPVAIERIDGREVTVNRHGFELDPGRHTMSGRAFIDTSFCSTVGGGSSRNYTPEPLDAQFEAGKTYWVGLDHSARDRKDWKYVIWKVKD